MIDFLTLAVGPEHHDLSLRAGGARIIFDSPVFHLSNMKIEIKNLRCIVNKLVKKEITLKLSLRIDHHIYVSEFINPIIASQVNVNQKQISYSWISSEEDTLFIDLANFSYHDLSSSSLSLIVYDTKLEKIGESDFITSKLSNCRKEVNDVIFVYRPSDSLGFSKFNIQEIVQGNNDAMTKQSSIIFKQGSAFHNIPKKTKTSEEKENEEHKRDIAIQVFDSVETTFCEELLLDGKNIGILEGRISITDIPLIKQIICGVHTERGFDLASHYLTYNDPLSSSGSKELIKEVKNLQNQSNDLMLKLTETTALQSKENQAVNQEILNHLKEINSLLLITSKDSCLFYNYNNKEEIILAQEVMLKLGSGLIDIIDDLKIDHTKEAMKIIHSIITRAEFDLSTMAYNIDDPHEESLTRRIAVCQDYINFYNSILAYVLDKFAKKVSEANLQQLIEQVISVCYFRVPKFRKAFLEAISIGCDFNIGPVEKPASRNNEFNYEYMRKFCKNEHIGIQYVESSAETEVFINPIVSTIDWQHLFYNRLPDMLKKANKSLLSNENFEEIINKVDASISKSDWKERLARRNLGYLSIIKRLEDYIRKKIIVNREIDWAIIPGFDFIIYSILHELKMRDVSKYPKLLMEVLSCFINNDKIINIFFFNIAIHTNIHDTNAVYNFLDIVDSFFHLADVKISNLKNYFDYTLLGRCLTIIVEADHSLCVSKLLWFLYENSHLINEEHLQDKVIYLVNQKFYFFFFHWAWQVRHVFYHYLLYILLHRISASQRSSTSRRQPQQNFNSATSSVLTPLNESSNYCVQIQESVRKRLAEIHKIIDIVQANQLDPTFKSKVDVNDLKYSVTNDIPNHTTDFIVVSLHHFKPVYKEYDQWLENIKKKKLINFDYPDVSIAKVKDDIIDYSESWS